MHTENTILSDLSSGLAIIYAGEQVCPPHHSYGPCARDYYLLHYIVKGRGTFSLGDKKYTLSGGDVFFIRPGEVVYYEADGEDPWHYIWIGLSGLTAGQIFDTLSGSRPVLHVGRREALFPLLQDFAKTGSCRTAAERYARLGKLYTILSLLVPEGQGATPRPSGRIYAEEAAMYICSHLDRRISISHLASKISIDRSYLCAVFKKYMGLSPQQYAIDVKMKSAALMLRQTDAPISQIAAAVGYDDPLLFSRIFKEKVGKPPKAYRAEM